jgi:hypothetical protein
MTMKSHPDPNATEAFDSAAFDSAAFQSAALQTEVLRPVPRTIGTSYVITGTAGACEVTEKLVAVSPATSPATAPATEKLSPIVAAIPAQRQDSHPVPTPAHGPIPAQPHRPRPQWEHLPTERHPIQAAPTQRPASKKQTAPKPLPKQSVSESPAAPGQQRWQRSAVTVAPTQGTLAAAGFAACDYLIRTVSILGLLAVVGMVTAGTAQSHTQEQTPGTTVATAPAHPGAFTSTHRQH